MTTPRRQLIRPVLPVDRHQDRDRQLHKLRSRLESERAAFSRWMTRLKRAFHSVEKIQRRLTRIERNLNELEE
jgi:hypothetical protein